MNGLIKKALLSIAVVAFLGGCASSPSSEDGSPADSEFSEFDKEASSATTTAAADTSSEDALEKELNESQGAPQKQEEAQVAEQAPPPAEEKPVSAEEKQQDDFAQFEQQEAAPAQKQEEQAPPPDIQPEPVPVAQEAAPPPPVIEEPTPVPPPEVPVAQEEPAKQQSTPVAEASEPAEQPRSKSRPVTIQRLQFKANDNGSTLAIEANRPMTFTTRVNPNTKQFIIEIPNSQLTKKAKRTLNTKDFPGGIGSIDPYQSPGTKVSRIVMQLRDGAEEPTVEAEGNSLLVVTGTVQAPAPIAKKDGVEPGAPVAVAEETHIDEGGPLPSKILSSASLEQFMAGNQQFFGKKISLEANDAELKEVFKFLSDESGINLVLSEDVKGKISILLKQVPWDQALVVIMQAKKLGYVRQGQILRISKLSDIKQEEDDFSKLAKARQSMLPLTVKMLPISYAKTDDIVRQITPFLSERGKAISESRTSSVVISDTAEVIERVEKLVASLDTPPAQVLIEGKIVEARDTFSRFIGVNWGTSGDTIDIGANSKGGKIGINAGQYSLNPISAGGIANLNFSITALDFLGDLNGALGLGETTGEVKVLSSPRVLTLHNEPAEITQTASIPYTTSTPGPNGTSIPKVDFVNVSLKLSTTPQVTNDASVILSVDMTREFAAPVSGTGAPPTEKRAAKTKVIVRNGQTAVIGGIYSSDTTEQESRLPGLGSIPVLGWLFKSKSHSRQKNELLIFLTPRIIGQADTGLANSQSVTPGPVIAPPPQSAPAPSMGDAKEEGLEL